MENTIEKALVLKLGKVNGKLTKLLVSTSGKLFKVVRMMPGKTRACISKTMDPLQYKPGIDLLVEIKPCYNRCGYQQVHVRFTDGSHTTVQVGRLVLETFVSIPSGGERLDCNHKDWNRSNNDLSNLEWMTHKDNSGYHRS